MKTKEIEEMISDLINRKATPADLINYISTLRQSVLEEVREKMPKYSHSKLDKDPNPGHAKDEFWGCPECYEDSTKNEAIDQVTSLINNLIEEK